MVTMWYFVPIESEGGMNDKQKAFADRTATFAIAIGGDERTFDIEWNKKSRDSFPWSDYEEVKKYYMEKIGEMND